VVFSALALLPDVSCATLVRAISPAVVVTREPSSKNPRRVTRVFRSAAMIRISLPPQSPATSEILISAFSPPKTPPKTVDRYLEFRGQPGTTATYQERKRVNPEPQHYIEPESI
jgi:hypothetical protein